MMRHAATTVRKAKPKMTPEFRRKMLQQAALVFGLVVLVLLLLVGRLREKPFLITAMVLIPVAALVFNFMQRRAFAAEQQAAQQRSRR